MEEAVIAKDGQSYNKGDIEAYFKIKHISPITRAELTDRSVTDNFNLRSQISEFVLRVEKTVVLAQEILDNLVAAKQEDTVTTPLLKHSAPRAAYL